MEGCTYFLRNICSFDSVVQILATAAIDDVDYHRFLQKNTNSTLKFVYNFITQGVSKNLFVEKARILAGFCNTKVQAVIAGKEISREIAAWNNVANTIKYTLSSHPSKRNIEECSLCSMRTICMRLSHQIIQFHSKKVSKPSKRV